MSEEPEDDDFYDYDEDDVCDHVDYDTDILTGRAHCWRCGEAWWLTDAELRSEIEIQAQAWLCEESDSPSPPTRTDKETR